MYEPHLVHPALGASSSSRDRHRQERAEGARAEGAGAFWAVSEEAEGVHAEFVPLPPRATAG